MPPSPPPSSVILKPGKEKALLQHHHWIFSGAVESLPRFRSGDFLPVYSSDKKLLGSGYFNKKSGIIGRMVAFDETPPLEAITSSLKRSLTWRQSLFDRFVTNSYRLVNGEGDCLPGLVIDIYDKTAVLQLSTLGMERLKPWLIDWLQKNLDLQTIYEKSLLPTRREEGLELVQGFLAGEEKDDISFLENGLTFTASLSQSQKTGFFLDHREMRDWVGKQTSGKRVLNAFSYSGGFSLYALKGGATSVHSVDISEDAINRALAHTALNNLDQQRHQLYCEDVFEFLRNRPLDYDFVILDPPAFAKKQKDIIPACRGYKDINRLAIQKMAAGSLLLTCSCSYHVDEQLFQKVLFQAALEAKRNVRIVGKHRLALDHPVNVYHPETNYLKSFLVYID